MAKKMVKGLFNLLVWATGIIVSLSVGFSMIAGTLTLPSWLGGSTVATVAGWIVVITTFLGILTALIKK